MNLPPPDIFEAAGVIVVTLLVLAVLFGGGLRSDT